MTWPKPAGGRAATAKRDALLSLLKVKDGIMAIAVAVLIPEYKRIRDTDPRARQYFPEDAYECALQSVFFESAKIVGELGKNHQIAFISDLSNKSGHYTKVFNAFRVSNPNICQSVRGLAHLDDKRWPGLQAADLCAHIAKTTLDKWDGAKLTERNRELESRFYFLAYWNEDYMKSVLDTTFALSPGPLP
jgi:hypothetical protein